MDIEYYKKYEPLFGFWHITKELGKGSHGTVVEIERIDFGIPYKAALKVISIPHSQNEYKAILSEGLSEADATEYFHSIAVEMIKKVTLMSQMKGQSNIVGYEDHQIIEHTDGIGWDILIRMELLTPLSDYLHQHDFKEQDVIRMGIDICKALETCQKHSIIHRKIKPETISVSTIGEYKLGNFFDACLIEEGSKISDMTGAAPYMAPEIYRGEAYSSNTDIYSLGLVMYRLANKNRLPFDPPAPQPVTFAQREAAFLQRINANAVPPPVDASRPLAEVICKACEPDPQVRYQSATEMRISLENLLKENEPIKSAKQDGKKQEKVDQIPIMGQHNTASWLHGYDQKTATRLEFCKKYIPVLQMIDADPDLKATCKKYSVYVSDGPHRSLIEYLYECFMREAYDKDIVVTNYGKLTHDGNIEEWVATAPEEKLRALDAEHILGCIAWHFRRDHFIEGSLISKSIADGHMLRMLNEYANRFKT